MTQKGTVIKIEQNKAQVAIPRASACGDYCAACPGGCQARGHLVWLENNVGARPGDKVLLSASTGAVLSGSLWVYLFPLILFFTGYGIAFSFTNSALWAIAISIICLIGSFFILHFLDKRIAPHTKILKVLEHSPIGKDETNGI